MFTESRANFGIVLPRQQEKGHNLWPDRCLFSKSFPNVHGLNAKVWQNARQRFDHLQHCHERLCKETGSVKGHGQRMDLVKQHNDLSQPHNRTQRQGEQIETIWLNMIDRHNMALIDKKHWDVYGNSTLSYPTNWCLRFSSLDVVSMVDWKLLDAVEVASMIWELHDLMLWF